jgi:hypothetical protein
MTDIINNKNELLDLLNQVRGWLTKNETVSEYFRSELEWIKHKDELRGAV